MADGLIKNLSEEYRNIIGSTKESELLKLHFRLGMIIRSQYGLWSKNQNLLNDCDVTNPDEASSIMIKKLGQKLGN